MEKSKYVFLALSKKDNNLTYTVPSRARLVLHILDISHLNSDNTITIKLKTDSVVKLVISCFAKKKLQKNFQIKIDHLEDNASSSINAYVVAAEQANVKVKVVSDIKPKTTKNATAQEIKGVLLSNSSSIHGEPQLIIDDNNVKATHAMAIGSINPNQIFYLTSRGIDKATATQLILMGYFNAALNIIEKKKERNEWISKVKKLFKENRPC